MAVIPKPNVPEQAMPWAREITKLVKELSGDRDRTATNSTALTQRVEATSELATAVRANAIVASIKEWVSHTSSTAPPSSGWSTETPLWEVGKYIWERTIVVYGNGTSTISEPVVITGAEGQSGEDAVLLRVSSTRGTSFKNSTIATVLTVTVFKGSKRVTTPTELAAEFGSGAYLEWWWRRMDDAAFGVISSADSRLSDSGFSLTISPADVDEQSVFECRLHTS